MYLGQDLQACRRPERGCPLAGRGPVHGHGGPVHQLQVCQVHAAGQPAAGGGGHVQQVHAGGRPRHGEPQRDAVHVVPERVCTRQDFLCCFVVVAFVLLHCDEDILHFS